MKRTGGVGVAVGLVVGVIVGVKVAVDRKTATSSWLSSVIREKTVYEINVSNTIKLRIKIVVFLLNTVSSNLFCFVAWLGQVDKIHADYISLSWHRKSYQIMVKDTLFPSQSHLV